MKQSLAHRWYLVQSFTPSSFASFLRALTATGIGTVAAAQTCDSVVVCPRSLEEGRAREVPVDSRGQAGKRG